MLEKNFGLNGVSVDAIIPDAITYQGCDVHYSFGVARNQCKRTVKCNIGKLSKEE